MNKFDGLFRVLNNLKLDGDGGSGGTDDGNNPQGAGNNPEPNGGDGNNPEPKTFTQEQVNSMIAAEKRKNFNSVYKGLGFDSEESAKAFVEKYKEEEEKNKSELVKEQEKAKRLEAEKAEQAAKAQNLEYKFTAISEGCTTESAADVVTLAKAKMSDDKDFATALKEVKEQYPSMFGQIDGSNSGTGGGGTAPRGRMSSKDVQGMGARLAKQRRESNAVKNTDYFK